MFAEGGVVGLGDESVEDCATVCVKRCGGYRGVVVDFGLTPIEIIIGVTLLAILAGVVVFQAFRYVAKADDSAASRSLQAAVTVAEVMGRLDASHGGGNLVGDPNPSTQVAITKLSEQLTGAKLVTLEQLGIKYFSDPGANARNTSFVDVAGDAQKFWVNLPNPKHNLPVWTGVANNLAHFRNPNLGKPDSSGKYYIEPSDYPEFPKGHVHGFRAQPGNLIRIGLKSVSGATFCVILVRDGAVSTKSGTRRSLPNGGLAFGVTDNTKLIPINGVGYQSVNAKASSKVIMGPSAQGADCGVSYVVNPRKQPPGGEWGAHRSYRFAAELPGLPGTDTRLMRPGPDSYGHG